MSIKKKLPNTLTCCNLLCGCVATLFAFKADFTTALVFIIVGAVFDFFDGFAARLLHVSGSLGKELDSLADDITFGFAPAAAVFTLLTQAHFPGLPSVTLPLVPYIAFLIAAFSALRLAKFNLDARQTMGFIGLPTPANALFWAALASTLSGIIPQVAYGGWFLLVGIVLSCWLLVAEFPMFALKFKHFHWRGNRLRYTFLLLSLLLLLLFGRQGLPLVIVLYVFLSLVACKLLR